MPQRITIRGRLVGPRNVELERPVSQVAAEVEVVLHAAEPNATIDSLIEYLGRLPEGKLSREELDRQIAQEREAWGRGEDLP